MTRLVRQLTILLIAVALAVNTWPAVAAATSAVGAPAVAEAHSGHDHGGAIDVVHQALSLLDQADCHPGDHADGLPGHSSHDAGCKKCCGVCITVSLMPNVVAPTVSSIPIREGFFSRTVALIAHPAPSEPGIPKPLT